VGVEALKITVTDTETSMRHSGADGRTVDGCGVPLLLIQRQYGGK
jgi:hypothetical protein